MFTRTAPFFSDEAAHRLAEARVIIFGVGGVGSWCAEALVRTGIMHLTLVDFDTVAESNINRQMQATPATVGESKVEAMRRRLLTINPAADIVAIDGCYSESTAADFQLQEYDYVIDAIDSVADKALLIVNATQARSTRLFSSMGAARRVDPGKVSTVEFSKVTGCPLARALRQRFKKTGVYPRRKFKAVYSSEPAIIMPDGEKGSLCQVTSVFGMHLAALVINDLRSQSAG